MISVEGIDRPGRGHRLLGHIASCYWTMMRRLAERLTRGERDDARPSALSQKIGRVRQKIRADLRRRPDERTRKRRQRKATRSALLEHRGDGHEP